jgi:hypothetical protein
MFRGLVKDGQVVLPPADTIRMTIEGVVESRDPEHPDSTKHYRLVAVQHCQLRIQMRDHPQFITPPDLNVFHLVRGDAAVRATGQPGDSTRWYIRRWLENLDQLALTLSDLQGKCEDPKIGPGRPIGDEDKPSSTAAFTLAIHPLGNPACPTLDVLCDLPGIETARLEVFDVMGRRVAHQEFPVAAPGTLKLQAGAGGRLAPGAYWVSLRQGSRRTVSKLVVVAR